MKYLYKRTPEIIALLYLILFFGYRDIHRPWDRVINSDGKGYYAYLPAIFIYKDLQFGFVEGYEYQYYPGNRSVYKEFRMPAGDRVVNKYFPGMAVIWLPFFLLGHLFAWLEVFPRDGYSLPYQAAIAFSALFFLWIGAKLLFRLLKKFSATDGEAALLTLTVTLGTNLLFFTLVESSMTHVYSFALITGFLVTAYNLLHSYRTKWLLLTVFLYLLIVLIRPTNALVLLLIPFLAGNTSTLVHAFRNVVSDKAGMITGMIIAAILVFIPFLLWKEQTGKWLVYTYGEEKLNFLQPNVLNILFSYNRGWFLYTPLALVSLFGLVRLFRENRFGFFWVLLFLFLFIYTLSSWWVWYYASKCGQRVFIDIYALVGVLLLYLLRMPVRKIGRTLIQTLFVMLILLNGWQFHQHYHWIFPPSTITGPVFRDAFFSLHPRARVYLPEEVIQEKRTAIHDMETNLGWMNERTRSEATSYQGKFSSRIEKKEPYSVGLEVITDTLFTTRNRIIRVSAMVFSVNGPTEATLVADFQKDGMSLSYNPFYLETFVRSDRWEKIEAAFYVPSGLPEGAMLKVYFYNNSVYHPLFVDEMQVDFLSFPEEKNYMKIEGVVLPQQGEPTG